MPFGLSEEDIRRILKVTSEFPQIRQVIIYGSRAKGTYKKGSDVDLALKGELTFDIVSKVHYRLNEETIMPYFFDVADYDAITNMELKAHIDRVGRVIS